MITKPSTRRLFGLISTALVASITMQWLIIPKIQWNSGVNADVTFPSAYDSVSQVNYARILNRATDYGIVADHFYQKMHMETTFATNHFSNPNGAQNNDVDFIDGQTAHFLIAGIDEGSRVRFGANNDAGMYDLEVSEDFLADTVVNSAGAQTWSYSNQPRITS